MRAKQANKKGPAPAQQVVVMGNEVSSPVNFSFFQRQLQRRGRYPRGAWGGWEGPVDEKLATWCPQSQARTSARQKVGDSR